MREREPAEKIAKLGRALDSPSESDFFDALQSHWQLSETPVIGSSLPARLLPIGPFDPVYRMMLADQTRYLPNDILVKSDRASMAFSLEAREPLLDHRLFSFAWRIPRKWLVKSGS